MKPQAPIGFQFRPLRESYLYMAEKLANIEAEFIENFFKRKKRGMKMNPLLERILLEIIKRIIDDEAVAKAKVALVEFLADLAKKTDNGIDDYMVSVIAVALGVPYETVAVASAEVLPHNNA